MAAPSVTRNRILWVLQGLLALLFLFAGVMKFVMPVEQMNNGSPVQLSSLFLHFIGVCEVLGALGLILPGLLGIRPGLTPLAAVCLAILMGGAVVIPLIGGAVIPAIFPLVVGLILLFVARERRSAIA